MAGWTSPNKLHSWAVIWTCLTSWLTLCYMTVSFDFYVFISNTQLIHFNSRPTKMSTSPALQQLFPAVEDRKGNPQSSQWGFQECWASLALPRFWFSPKKTISKKQLAEHGWRWRPLWPLRNQPPPCQINHYIHTLCRGRSHKSDYIRFNYLIERVCIKSTSCIKYWAVGQSKLEGGPKGCRWHSQIFKKTLENKSYSLHKLVQTAISLTSRAQWRARSWDLFSM